MDYPKSQSAMSDVAKLPSNISQMLGAVYDFLPCPMTRDLFCRIQHSDWLTAENAYLPRYRGLSTVNEPRI